MSADGSPCSGLTHLRGRGFRNLAEIDWRPGPGTSLLTGSNGAGKTSVLEAVYVLATTRSFRTGSLAECAAHGIGGFRLEGRIEGVARVDLTVGWGEAGRERAVNGRQGSLAEHLAVLPVVSWTAADRELVEGGPAARRRFLDRGVVGMRPGSLEMLARYRRALEEKRELLARGGGALAPWNELLAGAAAEIARLRGAFVGRLADVLAGVIGESGLDLPPVSLRYRPSPDEAEEGPSRILAHLERSERQERERGMPLIGPHRDELEISWGSHEARRVASGGERKLLGLALTAARGRTIQAAGRDPLYVLDDLDAELDPARLAAVWELFRSAGQVLVSSNREALWQDLATDARWVVEDGSLGSGDGPGIGPDV